GTKTPGALGCPVRRGSLLRCLPVAEGEVVVVIAALLGLGLLLLAVVLLAQLIHGLLPLLVVLIQGYSDGGGVAVPVDGEGDGRSRLVILHSALELGFGRYLGVAHGSDDVAHLEAGLLGAGAVQDGHDL